MRAVQVTGFTELGPMTVKHIPIPQVGVGEVLVRVLAAGVCFRDIVDRRGAYPNLRPPLTPGHEFAGEVVEVAPGVVGLELGDYVTALTKISCGECPLCVTGREQLCRRPVGSYGQDFPGAYAEYVKGPARTMVKLPRSIPPDQAASIACTVATPLHALKTKAKVKEGETVLVTGAGGGLGIHTLQLAHHMGARVIAVTSSEPKAKRLLEAGADQVIVSDDGTFAGVAKSTSGGAGVDVVIEIAGPPTFAESLRSLAPGGRLVVLGSVNQEAVSMNPGLLILKEIEIYGSMVSNRAELEQAAELVRSGVVRPVIAGEFTLEEADAVHQQMLARSLIGRAVLVPNLVGRDVLMPE
jgi:D-arabinose 1-dehydrogenase-like Zn-dependent alcohol dehydrogenase